MYLHAADPHGTAAGTFTLTIPGTWTTKDVPFTMGIRSTTLTIPRAGGATKAITLTRTTARRRAVR
jgi:hypothetical protein